MLKFGSRFYLAASMFFGLCIVATPGLAATVSLLPSSSNVLPGASFSIDVVGSDFTSNADSGDFTMSWNPAVITFTGISIANPPWDTSFVNDDNISTGTLDSVFLGTSTGGGVGPDFEIATLTFSVSGSPGDSTQLTIGDDVVGWFAPGAVAIDTSYTGATVNVVPIPAAAWLFGSGLAGLMLTRRRRECRPEALG